MNANHELYLVEHGYADIEELVFSAVFYDFENALKYSVEVIEDIKKMAEEIEGHKFSYFCETGKEVSWVIFQMDGEDNEWMKITKITVKDAPNG